jgi:hypothetical protein
MADAANLDSVDGNISIACSSVCRARPRADERHPDGKWLRRAGDVAQFAAATAAAQALWS